MVSTKETTLRALNAVRSDDLNRARAAFRDCTSEQMQEVYGQSGQTRAEILKGYEDRDTEVIAAIKWVESLPNS